MDDEESPIDLDYPDQNSPDKIPVSNPNEGEVSPEFPVNPSANISPIKHETHLVDDKLGLKEQKISDVK